MRRPRDMLAEVKTSFGPFYVQNVIAVSDAAELSLATLFDADGSKPLIALRRLKRGPNAPSEELFLERAMRYAVLRHPNVAEVKDLGTLDGTSYVATEYVQGKSLLSALAACGRMGLGFPTDVALYIILKTLEALDHVHQVKARNGVSLGILHRDLRHSNVLLGLDGSVKLSDFEMGFASTHARTANGVCVGGRQGFFSYLAPEQTKDEAVDARTDLFSVGVVLYELVTGRHLFSDKAEDRLLQRVGQGAYDLPIARYRPDLHPELASIIRTALAPEPADRFGSAAVFLDALTTFLASVGVTPGKDALRELMERLFGTEEEPE